MATKEKRPRKAKQQYIPGTAPPTVPVLDKATEEYVEARDSRMRLTTREADAKSNLRALMKEHKLTSYECNLDGVDHVVMLNELTDLKVKKKKAPEGNGDEE